MPFIIFTFDRLLVQTDLFLHLHSERYAIDSRRLNWHAHAAADASVHKRHATSNLPGNCYTADRNAVEKWWKCP